MTDVVIKVEGLKKLDEAMKAFPNRVQKRMLGRATAKGALQIKTAVKAIVKAEAYDTGSLFRNVKTKRGKRPRRTVVRYMIGVEHGKVRPVNEEGKIAGRKGKLRKATRRERAGEDPYYYYFIELGTVRGVRAIRYLTRGLTVSSQQAINAMRIELKKQIETEYAK